MDLLLNYQAGFQVFLHVWNGPSPSPFSVLQGGAASIPQKQQLSRFCLAGS